jgi:hypothetical protein
MGDPAPSRGGARNERKDVQIRPFGAARETKPGRPGSLGAKRADKETQWTRRSSLSALLCLSGLGWDRSTPRERKVVAHASAGG